MGVYFQLDNLQPAKRIGFMIRMLKLFAFACSALCVTDLTASPAYPLNAEDTIAAVEKSARWHMRNPVRNLGTQRWEIAPYLDAMIELARISGNPEYWSEVVRLGNSAGWQPLKRDYHADDHAVGHAYLDTFSADKSKTWRLAPFKGHMDWIISEAKKHSDPQSQGPGSPRRSFNWCDALFMSPPTFARLYAITGDKKYLEYMDSEFRWSHSLLWSSEDKLFYRDSSYIGKKSPNGKKILWGRGNGWVLGGLSQILKFLPNDISERKFYEDLYIDMAHSVLAAQQNDGLWRANLADPEHIKGGETSASAFFVYALAWGINNSILPKDKFEPAVLKGWIGLLGNVAKSGKVGYVQPVGAAPGSFDKESTHAYGAGAFILAGCEVAKLLGASQKISDSELLRRAQQIYDASGVRAYACKVPRRKDDLAWENAQMAFRIYGPALEKSIENSGIDVWAKSVAYPVIDKWYDDDLCGKRSYHADHGEGLDAFKVADTVGLGGTGIWKGGKLYKSNVYKCAEVYWTTPKSAKFSAFYVYDIDGKTYSERKDFEIGACGKTCNVTSQFFEGRGALRWMELGNNKKGNFAKNIVAATGLLPQSKEAKISFVEANKTLSAIDVLAGKPFKMSIEFASESKILKVEKLKTSEEIVLLKPDSNGRISYKIGYTWGK